MGRTRRGFRMTVAWAVMLVGCIVAGCQSDVAGTPTAAADPFETAAKNAFDAAVEELAKRPAIRYRGDLEQTGATAGSMDVTVMRTNQAVGTAKVDGATMRVVVLDGKLAASTGKEGWRKIGIKESQLAEFARNYVVVEPDALGFDPREAMTPAKLAELLRGLVEQRYHPRTDSVHRPVTRAKTDDGTEVYRIPVGDGFVDVTVAEPHRIVLVSGIEPVSGLSEWTDVELTDVGQQDLERAFDTLEKALAKFAEATVYVPGFELTHDPGKVNCTSSGRCTVSVRVSNEIDARGNVVSDVSVRLRATVRGGPLGTRTCTDAGTMPPNRSTEMTCSVRFSLPAVSGPVSYQISARLHTLGRAVYRPDVEALRTQLQRDLLRLIAEVK